MKRRLFLQLFAGAAAAGTVVPTFWKTGSAAECVRAMKLEYNTRIQAFNEQLRKMSCPVDIYAALRGHYDAELHRGAQEDSIHLKIKGKR
jgi:hypothetical protein